MSDQYTRITCGGSALSKDAPVVGLLFGRWSPNGDNNNDDVQIVDADDIPTDCSEAAKSQVSLHHAVFPQNQVVGWYRVATCEEPNASDLALTQELKQHYYGGSGENRNNADKPFFFSLLQVKGNSSKDTKMKDDNNNDDDELPLNLYEIQTNVLVAVQQWSLETSEAERIAVERVVREVPRQSTKATENIHEAAANSTQPSPYVNYMSSVQHSLEAMEDRIRIIIAYLEKIGKGEVPPNFSLMRQIQGLILQLGPLQASAPKDPRDVSERDAALLSHLATVAKTVQAVQGYTEKFRTMYENRPSGGRERARAY